MADELDMLAPGPDHAAMAPYWNKVAAILGGVEAMRKVPAFLPKFPRESSENYKYRLANSKFTNIYRDIVESLAAKPFTKEVRLLNDNVPDTIKQVVEDIDGAGNHLHAFASDLFFNAINNAIDWILVDWPKMPQGISLADERKSGARPYWVRIAAPDMLEVVSAKVGTIEQFVYARIRENYSRREDDKTVPISRVRVLVRDPIVDDDGNVTGYDAARFEVWERSDDKQAQWVLVDEGPISLGIIALVPLMTGRRLGATWQVMPPLQDVADLQIEHYQQETNLKNAKELTAFPVLTGNGIAPPEGELTIGPSTVLYAPPLDGGQHGEWRFIEPSAASLKFLSEQVKETEQQMRELGRQPLMAGTAGITQVTAALTSQKVSSAVQAWAWLLKDALEKAFFYTAQWLNIGGDKITVFVNTRIAIDLGNDKAPDILLQMQERGLISRETLWNEMKERGVLSQEFDSEEEESRLLAELPGDDELMAALPPRREAA